MLSCMVVVFVTVAALCFVAIFLELVSCVFVCATGLRPGYGCVFRGGGGGGVGVLYRLGEVE